MGLSSRVANNDLTSNNHGYEHDVFLSYQSADEADATKVGTRLENEYINTRKIKIFYAPWDIGVSQNIVEKLNEGLEKAKFFLILLSPDALKADWPTAERSYAIYKDPAGRLGRVIPVIVKSCRMPPLLAFRNYVDLRDSKKYESEFTRLLCTIKMIPLPRGVEAGGTLIENSVPSIQITNAPDEVNEEIYSNLFRVVTIPSEIWSAPTRFYDKWKVFQYFGFDKIPPPFILRQNRLYAFTNISVPNNPFQGIIEDYDIYSGPTSDWYKKTDHRRWLIQLLNDAIRAKSWHLQLKLDKIGKKYYYPLGILKKDRVKWFPHVRNSERSLILEYKREERTLFYRHRAVKLKFVLIGTEAYLSVEPGWVFTFDGKRLIEGKRRSVLNTRINSLQKNLQVLDETRFWAWLLSDDAKTIRFDFGGNILTTNAIPVVTKIVKGIFGDWKQIPSVVKEPQPLLEEDDVPISDESETEDGSEVD